ncbi:hypothetical protein MRX96_013402 [Rhipicephalus microplus]
MASPRTRRVLQDLKPRDSNNKCFECGAHNPPVGQCHLWHLDLPGMLGKTPGSWCAPQFRAIHHDGQAQLDWDPTAPLAQRYDSKAAALYRDKIATEAQGKTWSAETSSGRHHVTRTFPKSSSGPELKQSFGTGSSRFDDSGSRPEDWSGGLPELIYSPHSSLVFLPHSYNFNSEQVASHRDEFFSRVQAQNATRPDDLPPSQGGRYSGFGNTVSAPPRSQSQDLFDGAWSSFSSGLATFAAGATKVASKASENAVKIGSIAAQKAAELSGAVSEKVKDGTLINDLQSQVTTISTKVVDVSRRGVQDLSTLFAQKATTLETAEGAPNEKSSLLFATSAPPSRDRSQNPDCSDTPLLQQHDRPFSPEREEEGWNWSAGNSGSSSPAQPKNHENDNWNDWEAGDAAWEPVTSASSPSQKSSSKAKASASKSSTSTKQGSSKSSSAKSPTSKLSPTKSLSSKKKGDEKLLIDFGEESWIRRRAPKGYQRISTKAD